MKGRRMLVLSVLTVLALASGCCTLPSAVQEATQTVRGSGEVVTETRSVSGFSRVDVSSLYDLTIVVGDREDLTVEAEDNMMRYVQSQVRGGTLRLGLEGNPARISFQPTKRIRYTLTVRSLAGLTTSGIGRVQIDDLETERLRLTLSGDTTVIIDRLSADDLQVNSSGVSRVTIGEGSVGTQDLEVSGASIYEAGDVESQRARVEISGAGKAVVWVTDTLDAETSGIGAVQYYGSPQLRAETSGGGKVRRLGGRG
ncbi:MAG: DUF2807 domain-containing protein [Chloroflexi bacterium]|nr:DUF2807 domain-containing protein [Chloroflexota bacterium]